MPLRRDNATQVSDAAGVARDTDTHERVLAPGGRTPTRSSRGQGHPGAGASGLGAG